MSLDWKSCEIRSFGVRVHISTLEMILVLLILMLLIVTAFFHSKFTMCVSLAF